jgi:hypothetical protein
MFGLMFEEPEDLRDGWCHGAVYRRRVRLRCALGGNPAQAQIAMKKAFDVIECAVGALSRRASGNRYIRGGMRAERRA